MRSIIEREIIMNTMRLINWDKYDHMEYLRDLRDSHEMIHINNFV